MDSKSLRKWLAKQTKLSPTNMTDEDFLSQEFLEPVPTTLVHRFDTCLLLSIVFLTVVLALKFSSEFQILN